MSEKKQKQSRLGPGRPVFPNGLSITDQLMMQAAAGDEEAMSSLRDLAENPRTQFLVTPTQVEQNLANSTAQK